MSRLQIRLSVEGISGGTPESVVKAFDEKVRPLFSNKAWIQLLKVEARSGAMDFGGRSQIIDWEIIAEVREM